MIEKYFLFHVKSWRYGYIKRLDKKSMVNFKIYEVTDDIVNNTWRTKGYHSMSFGQLIEYYMRTTFFEYYMRTTFLEKSYTKYGGEASSRHFIKTQNWANLWVDNLKYYKVCFYWSTKIY